MSAAQTEMDSHSLLALAAGGDRTAFRTLYDRHSSRLYAVALRIVRQPGLAADALQEAFVQVWQNARQFDASRGNADAWMTGLVRYRALDMLRRTGPAMRSLDEEPLTAAPEALSALDGHTDGRALRQCLDRLEADRRRLVVLAFVEGFSHAELATRLATPLGTVKSSIRRALASLRECLDA